tara:strand:- start:229 stop:495 length:267 start_codon:yes stop_codon:yes gene_type:complete
MPVYYENRKRYNTDTAEIVFRWDNDLTQSDFNYFGWELYRTPKGSFFQIDNRDRLIVLTPEEAYDLLELVAAGSDAIEKYFSDMIEEG